MTHDLKFFLNLPLFSQFPEYNQKYLNNNETNWKLLQKILPLKLTIIEKYVQKNELIYSEGKEASAAYIVKQGEFLMNKKMNKDSLNIPSKPLSKQYSSK